ncbi:MAG: hypothetical protein V1869_01075 [Candidatus Omnitrophota bacterium]
MLNDIAIRMANKDDISGIVALQKQVYGEYKRDAPFFIWQCFKNINPSVLIVAKNKNSIVGTLGIQKIKTTDNLCGGQLSWIVVSKRQRRKRIFTEMSRLALECMPGLDFIFIFANSQAVAPCESKLGMRFIGKLSQLISKPHSKAYAESYLEPISAGTRFPVALHDKKAVTFQRPERYRSWRYAKNTVHKYFKVLISPKEYAIIKLFKERGEVQVTGDIVDFECDIQNKGQLKKLFLAASFELMKMGATMITTWAVPGTKLRILLEDMGFKESNHCSFFGLRVLNPGYHSLYNFKAWHLAQSDASNY